MTKMSGAMFSVGTLLRRAEDTGTEVRVLVQGSWIDGRVLGCDGVGAVLDDGTGGQVLVRLDSIAAIQFSRNEMEGDDLSNAGSWAPTSREREPVAAGPVSVPAQQSRAHAFTPTPY